MVFFPLIPEDDIPGTGVKKAELAYTVSGRAMKARIFLVSSSGGLTAFSAVCSHLGCLVNYHRERHEFVCPCHGGKYDLSGKNISGPPPAPLTRFPVKIQDGTVFIGMKV
jgi:Rieske Fe-S protein